LKTLYVDLADHRYPIMVGQGLLSAAGNLLAKYGFESAPIVITNRTVLRLHGFSLLQSLRKNFGPVPLICIGDGERFKTHATLLRIYDEMFRAHADRRSWILAFGGGVVGDIAGYAAATFMRGIPFVMAPTTLLAQVDSSIGGKVGINVDQGKNLIGAFNQPSAVLSDTDVLKTLPSRELASGLYEIIKCGAIRSEPLLRYLEKKLSLIMSCQAGETTHVILEAARIKAGVVACDEKETGLRMILNYGHTVGHAFEAATGYKRFKHGEAVAWGMIAAVGYGRELGRLNFEEAERLVGLIQKVGPLPSLKGIFPANLWSALTRDKKFRSGDIRMIFLLKLGEAEIRAGIDPSSLQRFLRKFLSAGGRLEFSKNKSR
jgi:3-dehydroquinate synthase